MSDNPLRSSLYAPLVWASRLPGWPEYALRPAGSVDLVSASFTQNQHLKRSLLGVMVSFVCATAPVSAHWGHAPEGETVQFLAQAAPAASPAPRSNNPDLSPNRPILKTGSRGPVVSELQAVLRLLGFYQGTVDGFYGESTTVAVTRLQRAAGLPQDGVAGPATWSVLFPPSAMAASATPSPQVRVPPATNRPTTPAKPTPRSFPSPAPSQPSAGNPTSAAAVTLPVLKRGMRGPAVIVLQERLRTLGFLRGGADGVFGAETLAAVKAAQQKLGLEADGVVGPATWSALLR